MSFSRLAVAVSLVLILALPFFFRPRAQDAGDAEERIIVITPHIEHLRVEFARGFSEWHRARHGSSVFVDFRQPGGTSEIRKQLEAQYAAAVRRGMISPEGECAPGTMPFDLLFGGGSYEHDQVKRGVTVSVADGHGARMVTVPISVPVGFDASTLRAWFPMERVGSSRVYDEDLYWFGCALSSFGIVYNVDMLEKLGLPAPRDWEDLTDPGYAGWLALSDPRQSGSVATTYESILNNYGWERGWRILRAMSANAQYFSNSSTKAPLDVSAGEAASGVAIDFYGRFQAQATLQPGQRPDESRVGYVDPEGLVFMDPDPVSMLRGGPNPVVARRFIEYVLSEQGQSVWQLPAKGEDAPEEALGPRRYELRRMPIRPMMYEEHFDRFIDKVKPYEIASAAAARGWRSMIAPLMGAFAIDIHHDQQRAWRAMAGIRGAVASGRFDAAAAGLTAGEDPLVVIDELFYAMPTHVFSDGREALLTEATYAAVRADWRDPDRAAEHKIAYTRFFRENYRRIVAMERRGVVASAGI